MSKVAALIPARWGSSRFPGKPVHGIAGKPLIQHVWERCREAGVFDRIIVATDDMRIAETAFGFGAEVALTSAAHQSGTDRIAEVARNLTQVRLIFNVQGDEPLIAPELLGRLVCTLAANRAIDLITAAVPISAEEARSEHVVKVVTDRNGDALYFSRSMIPFARDTRDARYLKHLGIYGYRRKALLAFVKLSPSSLEQSERLEQLRALQNGMKLRVIISKTGSIGVDTLEDAEAVEKLILGGTGSVTPTRDGTE
ncbi:MAG: 3-deoxy-manno-octulosonate cytidylyltransferase [Verrucomicrobia bacterium]|nr:3-deoxy-manno-octulosonate cytidylyltransferase [Verrucomicrobiota bacterium]